MNNEPAEPAQWKRYRGGAGGKIWYSPDGSQYTRILAEVGDNLVNPMRVGPPGRVLVGPRGGRRAVLRAPGRHGPAPAHRPRRVLRQERDDRRRSAWSTSGPGRSGCSSRSTPSRCGWTYGCAESAPGGPPFPVSAKSQLGSFALDSAGRALAAEVRGTVHWLPGRGRARPGALLAEPGVRARLPVVIPGTDAVACASDNGGEDGLDVIPADGSAARRIGHGEFGRIMELAVAPDGRTAAVACDDGRLLTVALAASRSSPRSPAAPTRGSRAWPSPPTPRCSPGRSRGGPSRGARRSGWPGWPTAPSPT